MWDNPAETNDLDLDNKCNLKFGSIIYVYLVREAQGVIKGFSLLPIGGICLGGWPYSGRTLVGGAQRVFLFPVGSAQTDRFPLDVSY